MNKKFNKTMVIVGNGAVENGWKPIKCAIEKTFNGNCHDSGELFLAGLTFRLNNLIHQVCNEAKEDCPFDNNYLNELDLQLGSYRELCRQIKSEFGNENHKVFLRKNSLLKFCMNNFFDVVTTNWDSLLEAELNKKILHIHGTINSESHYLYFPMQVTHNFSYLFEQDSSMKLQFLKNIESYKFKNEEAIIEYVSLGNRIRTEKYPLLERIENYKNLILWGIGLHIYDIELITILNSFIKSEQLDNILIINPDKTIVKRVKDLFPKVRVHLIDPNSPKANSLIRKIIYNHFKSM